MRENLTLEQEYESIVSQIAAIDIPYSGQPVGVDGSVAGDATYTYGPNLVVNPSAAAPLSVDWASSVDVMQYSAQGETAFIISDTGTAVQTVATTVYGSASKGVRLFIRAQAHSLFELHQVSTSSVDLLQTVADLFVRLVITSYEGTTTYILPCVINRVDTWQTFDALFIENLSSITNVELSVYAIASNKQIMFDCVSVNQLLSTSATDEADTAAEEYVDANILKHLEDRNNNHLSFTQKTGLSGGARRLQTIKLGLESSIRAANNKLYDSNPPIVAVEISRKTQPIITPQFWQETIVATIENVKITSVAVKQSGNSIDRVYVAYIVNDTAIIVSAAFTYPVEEMFWEEERRIEGCTSCMLAFDGDYITNEDNHAEVIYKTQQYPHAAYITTDKILLYEQINSGDIETVASGVTSADLVRGVASASHDIDQGMLIFFVADGVVQYRQYLAGVGTTNQIGIAPSNIATVHAEVLSDYRICLQLMTTAGSLWEVFSKMEASGWNSLEYIGTQLTGRAELKKINFVTYQDVTEHVSALITAQAATLYAFSPIFIAAYNIENELNDWGYIIQAELIAPVTGLADNQTAFMLSDDSSGAWSCTEASISGNLLTLVFANFNNATGECTLHYIPGTVQGPAVPMEQTSIQFMPVNLVPFAVEPPTLTTIESVVDWEESI